MFIEVKDSAEKCFIVNTEKIEYIRRPTDFERCTLNAPVRSILFMQGFDNPLYLSIPYDVLARKLGVK